MKVLSSTEFIMFISACDQVLSDTSCPSSYNNETAVTVLRAWTGVECVNSLMWEDLGAKSCAWLSFFLKSSSSS